RRCGRLALRTSGRAELVEADDVLECRLAHRLRRLADGRDGRDPVLGDDRLAIRPVGLVVDRERVGQATGRRGVRRELRLDLTTLVVLLAERVVDQTGGAAR